MGVEPFLVASSVEGVLAQRLLRQVCKSCVEPYEPDDTDMPPGFERHADDRFVRASGCRDCRQTGYRGRLGAFELLDVTEAEREMILRRASAPEIASRARELDHIHLLQDDGYQKARRGVTTFDEVMRALKA